jgi:hypothetical protein
MNKPNWQQLVSCKVPAKPSGLWTLAWDYVAGPKKLKLVATGTWNYADKSPCTADGNLITAIDKSKCLYADAPVGALIAKLGGSSSGIKDGEIFVVGQLCIKDLSDSSKGGLFLTINDELANFADNSGDIDVTIFEAL